jgi:hypothetical protein
MNPTKESDPVGEQFLKAEESFKERYKDSPQLLAEVDELTKKQSVWYISVFTNLLHEIKNNAIDEVAKKLDRL